MKSLNLKKLAAVSALGLVAILGTSEFANAQGRGRDDDRREDRRDDRQDRKIEKQQDKIRQQRAKIEQERIRAEQQRQAIEINRQNSINIKNRSNNGYYNGNSNNNRYRVYRNGSYYTTDNRGAELLRQAVNAGYQQGFQAGRSDYSNRRSIRYSNSNVYQSGTYGYQSYVNQSQYQYYFRQGFQRGYQDGSNSRYQNNNNSYGQYNDGYGQNNGYNQQYQYGSSSNGVVSILSTILSQILNIRQF